MNVTFLSLDAKKIITATPKAFDCLKAWVKGKHLASAEGVDLADYRQQLEETITDEYLETVLVYNPRSLYDFFDEQDILISIDPNDVGFTVCLHGDHEAATYPNRWKAEQVGFEVAFTTLENQLNGNRTEADQLGNPA